MTTADIIHFYIGAKYQYTDKEGGWTVTDILECILYDNFLAGTDEKTKEDFEINNWITDGELKLILRHPNDMTVVQESEYHALCSTRINQDGKIALIDTPLSLLYCLKQGIDLFDLIENGIAINEKTFKNLFP